MFICLNCVHAYNYIYVHVSAHVCMSLRELCVTCACVKFNSVRLCAYIFMHVN